MGRLLLRGKLNINQLNALCDDLISILMSWKNYQVHSNSMMPRKQTSDKVHHFNRLKFM